MTSLSVTQPVEVTFAYDLLRALHADVNNVYLILAVIAWVRSESGSHYVGNNPLNMRPYGDDARYRSGVRYMAGNGAFSVYANLSIAAQASANRLLLSGSTYGYDIAINAARRNSGTTAAAQQKQAMDFLNAIAMSQWDAGHYGAYDHHPGVFAASQNRLISVWAGLTGHPVTIPSTVIAPSRQAVHHVPRPTQPHATVHQAPKLGYLSPGGAHDFYAARHPDLPPLTGDPYGNV